MKFNSVRHLLHHTVCLSLLVGFVLPVSGFEMTPEPTKAEKFAAQRGYGIRFRAVFPLVEFGLHQFSSPVHEALTAVGHECPGSLTECSDINLDFASSAMLAGVRWNDDPPFQFIPGQGNYRACPAAVVNGSSTVSLALSTLCWYSHFKDVAAIAERDPNAFVRGDGTLVARSHFGDLQFLHAMASQANTPAAETQRKLLMWAEFVWRIQTPKPDYLPPRTRMGAVPVEGLRDHFPVKEVRTIENLFTVGRPWLRLQLGDVAFGSLLHMVEDSFSGAHVTRQINESVGTGSAETGPASAAGGCTVPAIAEFHTYAGQDKAGHHHHDDMDHAAAKPVIVEVVKELVRRRYERQGWSEVRPYLQDCVWRLLPTARPASTGLES